ncbi:MAG: bifunctional 3-deoxy-7-phosphoheptulonate synthase/chorismate mutase type II [Chitinispirillaceae bacterium]|nr:bifunctional 3-deoxy-7-phosphoheptulonate synthase/chorismate mutase type II [Chitinispirillaceae bacterium]
MSIDPLAKWNIPCSGKFFIAGPCSVESEDQILQTALQLSRYKITVLRGGIWKPRTHPGLFEGIGVRGLTWLKNAGLAAKLPVATEVANPAHVEHCLKAGIDLLWIGARTTTNPFLIQEITQALRGVDIPVMVKNPINPDLELWIGAIERISNAGIKKIMAIHRGFFTYRRDTYRNHPIWKIPIELRRQSPHLPLICDPSHICGDRKYVFSVAQEAMDFLFDGLMIEVHPGPDTARSDGKQQITPASYGTLMKRLRWSFADIEDKQDQQKIALLRSEIDAIDNNLIGLLGKRMEFVRDIGAWKRDHNVSLLQLERWRQVLSTRLQKSGKKSLSKKFIRDIFEQIHEEALRIQERIKK